MALKLLDVVVQSGQASDDTKLLLVKTAMRMQNYSVAHPDAAYANLISKNFTMQKCGPLWEPVNCGLRHAGAAETAFHTALNVDQTHLTAWTGLLEISADVEKVFRREAWKTTDAMLLALPVEGSVRSRCTIFV